MKDLIPTPLQKMYRVFFCQPGRLIQNAQNMKADLQDKII